MAVLNMMKNKKFRPNITIKAERHKIQNEMIQTQA